MSTPIRPLEYLDARAASGVPHLVVDGAAGPSTVGCLSHWPASPTPRALWRDTSTEIALAYLARPEPRWDDARAATNDHLDVDGACGLYVLADPEGALARADELVALARAGDFGVVADELVARRLAALEHLLDPARSVLDPTPEVARDPMAWAARAYPAAIELLPEILDHPEHFAAWSEADLARRRSHEAALSSGALELEEVSGLDLVVVRAASDPRLEPVAIGHRTTVGLDPSCIHARSSCARVLVALGDAVVFYDRYETWVRYVSVDHLRRRDLKAAALALGGLEPGGVEWLADDPGALVPVCAPASGRSELPLETILDQLERALRGPVAWEPFAERLAEVRLSGSAGPRSGTTGRGRARWRGPRATAR